MDDAEEIKRFIVVVCVFGAMVFSSFFLYSGVLDCRRPVVLEKGRMIESIGLFVKDFFGLFLCFPAVLWFLLYKRN